MSPDKLTQAETKELKYAKASTTKQQMQANRTTQVVVLDGSKAMRNLSTNNMNAKLEICKIEEMCQNPAETSDKQVRVKQNEIEWEGLVEVCKKLRKTQRIGVQQKKNCGHYNKWNIAIGGGVRNAPVFASFSGMDL